MKHQTPESMKFRKLQRRLGASKLTTVGTLELLWIACQRNAPEGDIGRFTNEELAIECEWDGDPDGLVDSLVDCGWLDRCETHRLIIHDWKEHAPGWIRRQLARHKRSFATPSSLLPVTSDQLEATPNLTQPNLTQPNPKEDTSVPSNGPVRQEYPDAFEAFWLSFPKARRTKKKEAFRKWKLTIKSVDCELLTTRAAEYAASPKGRSEYAVMPSVWLNSGMWEDDAEAWEINNKNRKDVTHDSRNDRNAVGRGTLFAG